MSEINTFQEGFPEPDGRHHVRANISLVIRFVLTFSVLIFAWHKWPEIHFESYEICWVMEAYLSRPDTWRAAIKVVGYGLIYTPVSSGIELAVILIVLWKFIRNGYIVSFFRPRVIAMILLSSAVIWLIYFELIDIRSFNLYKKYIDGILFSGSPFQVLLFPLGKSNALFIYTLLIIYLVGYLGFKIKLLICDQKSPLDRFTKEELEVLGINEVMESISPLRRMLLPRPRFYFNKDIGENAYCSLRDIVIGEDLLKYGREVIQGLVAHELGHYYHYDISSNAAAQIATSSVFLAIDLVAIPIQLVCILLSKIPLISILIGIPSNIIIYASVKLSALLILIIVKLFWLIDGRWAERAADIFAVNIGFGEGVYLFLYEMSLKYNKVSLAELLDEHPLTKTRLRYILRRIRTVWGKEEADDIKSMAKGGFKYWGQGI